MLIRTKKKRSNEEDVKNEADHEEKKSPVKNRRILELQNQVVELTKKLEDNRKDSDKNEEYAELLNNLYHKGIIDDKGNFLE